MKAKSINIRLVAAATAGLLMIPLVAMQFSEDVDWKLNDFVIMGALLFCTGLLLNFVMVKARTKKRRLIAATLITLVFLYIWAELAVGIFTNWGT
jgi:hypothetical protein